MLGFRQSKFKHIYGQGVKRELCYDNVRITKNAWDSNLIKVNPLFLSINWDAAGGGAFAVIPLGERGKLPDLIPLFKGHSAPVLDTDFNPFNDSVLASASEDGKICLWSVPADYSVLEKETPDVSPVSKLTGHSRKVGNVTFHPNADNVLASTSGDYSLKLWDIIKSSNQLTLKHSDIIQSISFNREGNSLVSTCRDKKIRIWDPRTNKVAQEAPGHSGAKNSRAVYISGDRIATAGFGKMSDRQLGLWDVKNLTEPIGGFTNLDQSAGVIMPFYDHDTKVLYLAGKGDGNIRYYEFENDEFWPLAEYKSSDPQRGVAFMPKRALSVHENEVMRAYKTVRDVLIEPISFIVPRRSEAFQEDIYPDTLSGEPSLSADDWFSGQDVPPRLLNMEQVYRNGANSHSSRKREFTPMPASESEPKNAPQEETATRTVSVVKPISQKSSPTNIKSHSSIDTKGSSSLEVRHSPPPEVEAPFVLKQSIHEAASKMEPESEIFQPFPNAYDHSLATLPADKVLQQVLTVVERQSETIENQAKKIQWLEEQHEQYVKALAVLEAKLNNLSLSKGFEGKVELEDDDGQYVEV